MVFFIFLDNKILFEFGRQDTNISTMYFTYPFSPIEAFGIGLSSFDHKIICE